MAEVKKKTRTGVALLGSETLLGREIQDVVQNRAGVRVKGFSANGEGNFGDEEGEAVYVEPLGPETVRGERVLISAGTREGAARAYEIAKAGKGKLLLIDCTGDLEDRPEIRLVDALPVHGTSGAEWLIGIPHPAAIALMMVLRRLRRGAVIRQVVATLFEPASERGKRGVSELHGQTTSLLSFKPLDKQIFDAQVSFNLLARYGEDAGVSLESAERRIERDLATLLSREEVSFPMPSIRLVQAPVFHGYSLSLWVEFDGPVSATSLNEALASAQIEIRSADQDAPDVVGAAGQSGLIAGDIRVDRNNPRAAWFWVVTDNLRLVADTAADLVKEALEGAK